MMKIKTWKKKIETRSKVRNECLDMTAKVKESLKTSSFLIIYQKLGVSW